MDKYHLILVIDRLKKGSKLPAYSDAWPWATTMIAFILAGVTATPRSFLGFEGTSWEALFIISALLSAGVLTYKLRQAWKCRKERAESPEEIVEDIIRQKAADRERAEH